MSFFVISIAYYPDDIEKRYNKPHKCTRTFGHFGTLEDAMKAVERNEMDMHECLYNYLLIEEIQYGIHAAAMDWEPDNSKQTEWWYRWEHSDWIPMKKPEWSQGTIAWSIG